MCGCSSETLFSAVLLRQAQQLGFAYGAWLRALSFRLQDVRGRRILDLPLRLRTEWGGYYGGSFGSLFRFPSMNRVGVFVDAGYVFAQGSVLLAGKKLIRGEKPPREGNSQGTITAVTSW